MKIIGQEKQEISKLLKIEISKNMGVMLWVMLYVIAFSDCRTNGSATGMSLWK